MQPTVTAAPLRQGRSSEKEITDLPNDLRDAVNMTTRVRAQITTKGTGVFTTAFASDNMPEGVAWTVAGSIMGRGTGVRCLISATTLYYRDPGGVATFQGIWGNPNIIVGALSAQFALNGNSVLLQVIDDAVHTVSWDVFVEMREVR